MNWFKKSQQYVPPNNSKRVQIIDQSLINIEASLIGLHGDVSLDLNDLMREISAFRKNWEIKKNDISSRK